MNVNPDEIFPDEKWGDFISLTIYALTFLVVIAFTIVNARRNKVKFDGLSRALTAREFVLFVSYGLGALNIIVSGIRPPEVRWSIRTFGIICNIALILLLATDKTRFGQWLRRHNPRKGNR